MFFCVKVERFPCCAKERQQNTASEVVRNTVDSLELALDWLSWVGAAAEELQVRLNSLKGQELSGRIAPHPWQLLHSKHKTP